MSTLYAALGGASTTSDLYTVDPATGAVTSVGPIGYGITGMAYDPATDTLYGSTNNNSASNPGWLITIDRTTGVGTLIGPQQPTFNSDTAQDLAFSGALYGWMSVSHCLATLDPTTGLVANIGSNTGRFGVGLDFSPTGTLYLVGEGSLWTVDLATSALTHVADLSGLPESSDPSGAASFDASGNLWLVLHGGTGDYILATVDIGTGALTLVGSLPDLTDALVWTADAGPGHPHVTLTTPPARGHYAVGASVIADWTATPASGTTLASSSGTVASGSPIDTSAGFHTFTVTATDSDGLSTTISHTYFCGADPPTVTLTTPPDGASYTVGQIVDADFSCTAGGSGGVLASCSGSSANGAPIDTSTPGAHTFVATATQVDGQTASETHSYWVGPAGPPSVALTVPADGAVFSLHQIVQAAYVCTAGPGPTSLASCNGPVRSGFDLDTSTAGYHTFAVTATDTDGQSTTVTHTYCVTGIGTSFVSLDSYEDPNWSFDRDSGYHVHKGRVYLSGECTTSPTATQTILTNLPAEIRPAAPVHFTLPTSSQGTSDTCNPALTVPDSFAATLYPDGSLRLDAPLPDFLLHTPDPSYWLYQVSWFSFNPATPDIAPQYTGPLYASLLLGLSWPLPGTPPADDYTPVSLAPFLAATGQFTDIDSGYAIHDERVHLSGHVRAIADGASALIDYAHPLPPGTAAGLERYPSKAYDGISVVESGGHKYRLDAYQDNGLWMTTDGAETPAGVPALVPTSPPQFGPFAPHRDRNQATWVYPEGNGGTVRLDYTFPDPGSFYCGTAHAFPDIHYEYGAMPASVPGFAFSVADIMAIFRPVPDWFVLELSVEIINTSAQNSCVRGNTLFNGPPGDGPYPINDTEEWNGAFLQPGPNVPRDVTMDISGASIHQSDGTPYDPTTDSEATGALRFHATGFGPLKLAPTTPLMPGSSAYVLQPPSYFNFGASPIPRAMWWSKDQASTEITVDWPNLIIGGGTGAPLWVQPRVTMTPYWEVRQRVLRAGDIVDLTGAGWEGTRFWDCAPPQVAPGFMRIGQALSGLRRRRRRIIGAKGPNVRLGGPALSALFGSRRASARVASSDCGCHPAASDSRR